MKRLVVFPCWVALAVGLFGSSAHASYNPVAGGVTRIAIDGGFLKLLKANHVKLEAKGGARMQGAVITLPVSGGEFDPLASKGTIETEGTLVFRSPRRSVLVRFVTLKAKRTPLLAKVGGSQLKFAMAKTVSFTRNGFGEKVRITGLVLTQKVATRLNKKLGLGHALVEGQELGRVTATAEPATVRLLPEGTVQATPDPAFMAKLGSLFVSLNPIFPAESQGGVFTFPIGGGSAISPAASLGVLRAGGALEFLQLSGGQVFWRDPVLDTAANVLSADLETQPSPPYGGKLGRVGVLDIERPSPAVADPGPRTISLTGASLRLSAASASAFNEAFAGGKAVFAPGEKFADLAFAARAR
jgi:hypothetical protein